VRRAFFAAPLIALVTVPCGVAAILVGLLGRDRSQRIARRWAHFVLAVCGVRVRVSGQAVSGPAVYVCNHVSALDIPILFAHLPADFRIVYKRSLHWVPLVGAYLWATEHVPIERSSPFRAKRSLDRAAERIRGGTSVVLFPEGTRRGTQGLGPFKRGSFLLAIGAGVPVVPISLAGVEQIVPNGLMSLKKGGTVRLTVHAPVATTGRASDQAETLACEVRAVVAHGLQCPAEA
jgi:1-acyl-sn-glycerol-3-phosphate acyltransferase